MTALAWKLNRLRCMSAAEIAHRVVKAAAVQAEKMGLAKCEAPEPDLGAAARPWIHRAPGVDPAPYVAAADRIAAGLFDVFALEGADLGNPPRWNRDPRTGIEAPLTFGKELDYRDERRVGDCKYLWEPNRHLHLVTLAQAYALTGESRHAEVLRAHLESWFAQCPFRMGANWSSALEAGLRLANWAFAWQLLGGASSPVFAGVEGAAFRRRWLDSVYQHAEFVCGHFSLHSSANNHLVGEAAGVYLAAVAWPSWTRAGHWRATAQALLEREALLQNAPDGVNREQSTAYHQWTFDLLLLPLLAARANGGDFAPEYARRLESMLDFTASVMDVGGNVPAIGDADDGVVARLDPEGDALRARSQLATGAILFRRADFKRKAGALDARTRWLLGPGAAADLAAIAGAAQLPVRLAFNDGGYYILGTDFETPSEIRLVADAGALGYREIAAHGHADALSFTLSLGGEEMLVDPGTYAYHTQPEWRAYFRGTAAHNTVRIDGRDQSEPGGSFMWLRKARARVALWATSTERDVLHASHDGYCRLPDPVLHRRRIALDKPGRRIVIHDCLDMRGTHDVEIFLHAAPEVEVTAGARGATFARGGRVLRLEWPEAEGGVGAVLRASTAPAAGWVSRRFDRREPAATLVWRARLAGQQVLRTVLECGPP